MTVVPALTMLLLLSLLVFWSERRKYRSLLLIEEERRKSMIEIRNQIENTLSEYKLNGERIFLWISTLKRKEEIEERMSNIQRKAHLLQSLYDRDTSECNSNNWKY